MFEFRSRAGYVIGFITICPILSANMPPSFCLKTKVPSSFYQILLAVILMISMSGFALAQKKDIAPADSSEKVVQDVEDYCGKLIRVCGKGGGFILTNGSSIDEAQPELIKAMVDSCKKFQPD